MSQSDFIKHIYKFRDKFKVINRRFDHFKMSFKFDNDIERTFITSSLLRNWLKMSISCLNSLKMHKKDIEIVSFGDLPGYYES